MNKQLDLNDFQALHSENLALVDGAIQRLEDMGTEFAKNKISGAIHKRHMMVKLWEDVQADFCQATGQAYIDGAGQRLKDVAGFVKTAEEQQQTKEARDRYHAERSAKLLKNSTHKVDITDTGYALVVYRQSGNVERIEYFHAEAGAYGMAKRSMMSSASRTGRGLKLAHDNKNYIQYRLPHSHRGVKEGRKVGYYQIHPLKGRSREEFEGSLVSTAAMMNWVALAVGVIGTLAVLAVYA
ncbi:hypothetical protein [Vibrio sp. WXL210]|uniref:hypothetical protein n=1 Tax=Vibrio sp. WXL210 TaxID=3450709 RepID=UPI003EC8173C